MTGNKIGLCMIVKDEAHVIERCLESVAPLVDFAVICDTGSNDRTLEKARNFMNGKKITGIYFREGWQDFATNRNIVLDTLRSCEGLGYALSIDADEVLEYADGFDPAEFKKSLAHDLYDIKTRYGGIEYVRPQLTKVSAKARYKGIVHEFVEWDSEGQTRGLVEGFWNHPIQDSARNKDPEKFLRDAKALEVALEVETDAYMLARYTFYLAQSYRDADRPDEALEYYVKRAAMKEGWGQEVYVSLLWCGRICEAKEKYADAICFYDDAARTDPARAEAYHGSARVGRKTGRWVWAYASAVEAAGKSKPESGLFVESYPYDVGADDELAVAAYWLGKYEECEKFCRKLLARQDLSSEDRDRIKKNLEFAELRLAEQAGLDGLTFGVC